jgi:hypothetical protein
MDRKPLSQISFENGNDVEVPFSDLQQSIMPVVLINDDGIRTVGTCFAISNHGLCLTARHVLEEIPMVPSTTKPGEMEPVGLLGALYTSATEKGGIPEGHVFGGFLPINKAHGISTTDIAILHLNLPLRGDTGERICMPLLHLRLRLPEPGEHFMAIGYSKGEWANTEEGVHTIEQTVSATSGLVSAVYPRGRDRAMLPTPCFQTSAPFHAGMSGGPLIDHHGRVFGVVTSGYRLQDGEEPISFATPIATSMFLSLRGKKDDQSEESTFFVWDFATGGAVKVNADGAEVHRHGSELLIRLGPHAYRGRLEHL